MWGMGGMSQKGARLSVESHRAQCWAQGSVLGPLFFLVYVNDMARACRGLDLVLFADDTNIFAEDSNRAELFGQRP